MIERRPFASLGGANHGWLDAKHHFSFAEYHDPKRVNWGAMRVWNDDTIQPGTGFFEFDLDRAPGMQIPGAWNAAEPELRWYDGLIWFQRRFDLPAPKAGTRSFLRFEGVNYRAYVYLNGKEVGRHEGGFTPFVLMSASAMR